MKLVAAVCLAICLIASRSAVAQQAALPKQIRNVLRANCFDCHEGDSVEGGLDLAELSMDLQQRTVMERWVKVFDRVDQGEMPPKDADALSNDDRQDLLATIERSLLRHERAIEKQTGRTVLRRLNRVEYENTVRDLLNVEVSLADLLPEDTPLYGFDTVSEGLRFSQLQIDKYLEAARVAVDQAIVLWEEPERVKKRFSMKDEKEIRKNLDTPEREENPSSGDKHRVIYRETDDAVILFASGGHIRQFNAPVSGRYRIHVSGYAVDSKGDTVALQVFAHRWQAKRLIGFYQMPEIKPREVEFTVHLNERELLEIQPHGGDFDDDGKGVWNIGAEAFRGRGLAVQWIDVEGPLGDWPPTSTTKLFSGIDVSELPKNQRPWRDGHHLGYEVSPADPELATKKVLTRFARKALRRPLKQNEVDPFVRLSLDALDEERTFSDAVRVGLQAILVSPQFLLLDEQPGKLNAHAVASRLSYFLCSSTPDDELLRAASNASLLKPDVLRAEADRLMNSGRVVHFIRNFTGQWLDLRRIGATSPDMKLYPEFDSILQRSMVLETEAFFAEMLAKDLGIANFIDSDFLMLDHAMSRHYRIGDVSSEQFERVAVPKDSHRGGLLTQAAVLKVTANGTVTSPVARGTWVMSRILGQPPQPPPPNIGSVEPDTRGASTIRELLAKHRDSETCSRCHQHIDPSGFALESFDVIGGWRDRYRSIGEGDDVPGRLKNNYIWQYKLGPKVDPSGQTVDGFEFKDIDEFKTILVKRRRKQVTRCVAEKLITYATGAGIRFSDRKVVDTIVDRVESSGGGLRTLLHEIVQSPLFLKK